MSGSVLAGASGVLQHVHERTLLGSIEATPVLNKYSGNRREGMFPTAESWVVPVVTGNPGGLEERVDGVAQSLAWHAKQTR